MDQQAEIRVTDWIAFGDHGFTHYRIWNREAALGRHDQRHEWKHEDGSSHMDEWIATPFKEWTTGARLVEAAE